MKTILFLFLLICQLPIIAQDSIPWHHNNSSSGVEGISLDDAYTFLKAKNKIPSNVIVAIIDSGIDTTHEDLIDRIWNNPNDIPNGIDDDGNGYVDDIHGWNFIGGADGRNVDGETVESVRFYRENIEAFEGKSISKISGEDKKKYKLWTKAKKDVLGKIKDYNYRMNTFSEWIDLIDEAEKYIKDKEELDTLTISDIKSFTPKNDDEYRMRKMLLYADTNGVNKKGLKEMVDYYSKQLEKSYNLKYNPRPDIVGDNTDDINDTIYGNNDIMAVGYSHGTGVSGVVGAIRNNGIGIQGIVDSVQLMILRVVPGGDERDKDVALAIKYAVKNGAKVINCSFGKYYSKHPEFVSEAIDYAVVNDVLIIHAAGNNAENNDRIAHFPTHNEVQKDNWIDVGASGKYNNLDLAASFSNYGHKSVDLFAPGVNIYTTAKNNNYRAVSGTSESSPVVAGIAALLRSYYPELSAKQVRDIIIESAVSYKNSKVNYTNYKGINKKIKFKKLSVTGAIVNALEAVKLAESKVL